MAFIMLSDLNIIHY